MNVLRTTPRQLLIDRYIIFARADADAAMVLDVANDFWRLG